MKSKVTVFNTIHEDKYEACNSYRLANILADFDPDVIFIETPSDENIPDDWDTMERHAIMQFRFRKVFNQPSIIPVDIPRKSNEWWNKVIKYFLKPAADISTDYQHWYLQDCFRIKQSGFAYLNSEECENAYLQEQEIRRAFAYSTGNQSCIDAYHDFYDVIEERDVAFIRNITEYCKEHTVTNGIFLVGAGHRKSLREKTAQQENKHVEWEFAEIQHN